MESRSKKILNLINSKNKAESNDDISQNISRFEQDDHGNASKRRRGSNSIASSSCSIKTKTQSNDESQNVNETEQDDYANALKRRRDSTSSSSSSTSSSSESSGPSFYEDSDDSVKDPDYQTHEETKYIPSSDEEHSDNEQNREKERNKGTIAKTTPKDNRLMNTIGKVNELNIRAQNGSIIKDTIEHENMTTSNFETRTETTTTNTEKRIGNDIIQPTDEELDTAIETRTETTQANTENRTGNDIIQPTDRELDTAIETRTETTPTNTENRTGNDIIQPTDRELDTAIEETENNAIEPTPTKKGRKRRLNEEKWKKNIAKRLRNCGKSYELSVTKKIIPERQLKEPCKETCIFKCHANFTEEQRLQLLGDYWKLGEIQKQWNFIATSVEEVVPKFHYVKIDAEGNLLAPKRDKNHAFYLSIAGKKIRVCKTFFKNTLSINNRPITTALQKKNKETNITTMKDNRGCHEKHTKVDDTIKKEVHTFIESIPKIESHYTRANSKKHFIDGSKTIADLHKDYVDACKTKNTPYANYVMFYRIFTEDFNLSFFVPKKDLCDVCEAHKNLSPEDQEQRKEEYERHHKEKQLSRLEKEKDKNNENVIVCVYDLQAVFPCPKGEISVFYYKSKLNVLNLTIYDIQKNTVDCYVWDESHANRGINEIGTCVFKYLDGISNTEKDNLDVIFYSDNCAGQQKNKFMIAMYLFAVQKFPKLRSITHKYLIKGHTQNEGDSAHSQIERQVKRQLRSGPMYTPDAFIGAIKAARKKKEPFRVTEMSYDDIFDWKSVCNQMNLALQKDEENNAVKITEIKQIKVLKDDPRAIYYKKSYADETYKRAIVIKKRKEMDIDVKKAYDRKPGITEKKKADLMELVNKNLIPGYYRQFFECL